MRILVVESRFSGKSLYLYRTLPDETDFSEQRLRELAASAAKAYYKRWQIEVFFQDIKTLFGIEKARVRTFKRLKNLLALCVLAYETVHRKLMGISENARKLTKSMKENLGGVASNLRTFLANLRELLRIAVPRSYTGRPRSKIYYLKNHPTLF